MSDINIRYMIEKGEDPDSIVKKVNKNNNGSTEDVYEDYDYSKIDEYVDDMVEQAMDYEESNNDDEVGEEYLEGIYKKMQDNYESGMKERKRKKR